MTESFVVARDRCDPATVRVTGRVARSAQAELANALSREAPGMSRLDLTGLDDLNVATIEVLLVLATEIDLEVLVRAGDAVARQVRQCGLDGLARVRALPDATIPAEWVAKSA